MNYPILLNREKPAKAKKISDGAGMFNFFMSVISLGRALALLMVPVLLLTASCKKDKETPAPTFMVTFEANEGSEVEPQTITEKEKATKPDDPTREGYIFIGWYTDEALTDAYDFDTPVTQNITLYAKWEEIMVTYDASTGTITGLTEKFEDAEDVQLKIPATINGVKMTTIAAGAFKGKTNIISLDIAEGITTIADGEDLSDEDSFDATGAFFGCTGLKGELSLPNTLTTIGDFAFAVCTGLTGNLTIGDAVETIGALAFYKCEGFTGDLNIPNSVTTIGQSAFWECTGFNGTLTIGDAVETIEQTAFFGCSQLTGDLTIPNLVTTIGDGAFASCTGLNGTLTIGDAVETIGAGAFQSCSQLTGSLTIPNSVTTIGHAAFVECSGFTGDLTIGSAVTTIGNSAFAYCSGFNGTLTIGGAVETIEGFAFFETSFTTVVAQPDAPPALAASFPNTVGSINVPAGSVAQYQAAEGWSTYSNIITAQQ